MTRHPSRVWRIATGLILAVVVLLIATVTLRRGCAPMSIREESKSAGRASPPALTEALRSSDPDCQ